MKIKNWKKFNEELQGDLFSGTSYERPELVYKGIWVLTPEDLEDYFIDFIDEGWNVSFHYGFHNEEYDFDTLITKRTVLPVIRIEIDSKPGSRGDEYLGKSLLSTINRLSPRFSKVKVLDEDGSLNPEDLKFEGSSIFIKTDSDDIEDELEVEGSLIIDLIWLKEIDLNDKMVFNYYKLEKNFESEDLTYSKDGVIVGFPVSEIKDWVLDRKSSYKDIVGNPDNLDFSYYDDYIVDHYSFFRYHLDLETKKLLIEKLIGDKLEELKEDYDFLNEFDTLDDLIKASINPGYQYRSLHEDLGNMFIELGDIYEDLRQMYSDYYNQQKMKDDYEAIMKSFYQIVEDVLHTSITEEYQKVDKLWYKLKFNFEWLEYEDDPEYIRKEGLNYIISNWCYKNYDLRELKPYFSDYASIDEKSFNKDCREILNRIGNEKQLESKDPKVGTGKKPKGSTRRLYTDENPDDTVPIKFRTLEDVRATINSKEFKSKSHQRQSQILNLIEQRLRVAVRMAKDPDVKSRLVRAHNYIKKKCQVSKEKTKKLRD